MIITEYIQTEIVNAKKQIKAYLFGSNNPAIARLASIAGIDSLPIKGQKILYSKTSNASESVFFGVVQDVQEAEDGEIQIFSINQEGEKSAYCFVKKDGNIELNGNIDNAVRYSKLEKAFNDLKSDFNSLVLLYNAHVHPANGSPTVSVTVKSTADISGAKIENLKTS